MLNTIQDIERYNVTNRLERNAPVGSNVIHLRSTPAQLVGATLTFEPGTVREESHVATAVSEHQVTLGTNLAYLHELDTPVVRLDLISLAQNGEYNLAGNVSIGGTSVTVNYVPGWVVIGSYVVIDPYTIECEVRKISNIVGTTLTLTSNPSVTPVTGNGLKYAHSAGDPLLYSDTDVINAKWFGASGDGVTSAALNLQAALHAAKKSDSRKLYIPAGVYAWDDCENKKWDGYWKGLCLEGQYENLELYGEGMGKTIILIKTYTVTDDLTFVRMIGKYQKVHDFTLRYEILNFTGDRAINAVNAGEWANQYYPAYAEIKRIEVDGLNGIIAASGNCTAIGTYCGWGFKDVNTTLAGGVSAGSPGPVDVTNMDGIYKNRYLLIGSGPTYEEIVVSSTTDATFTATTNFAYDHAAGEIVQALSQGRTHILIEDCIVHDGTCNAYGFASSANVARRCIARDATHQIVQRHGWYSVGGFNVYDSCWVEGWSGYSFHLYKQNQRHDSSGDMFVHCVSIDPQFGHMYVSPTNNPGTPHNPEIPLNGATNRYFQVIGCLFLERNGKVSGPTVYCNNVPGIVMGNVFENCWPGGGGGIVETYSGGANGTIIKNNLFTYNMPPASAINGGIIRVNGSTNVIIEGNVAKLVDAAITGLINPPGITITSGENLIIKNNIVPFLNVGSAINVIVEENILDNAGSTTTLSLGNNTGLVFRNNVVKVAGGYCVFEDFANLGGLIEDNLFGGAVRNSGTTVNAGLKFRNNRSLGLTFGANINGDSGSSIILAASGTVTSRRLVKWGVVDLLTSDTVFMGVAALGAAVGNNAIIMADIGAIVEIDADGAWTAGNFGIASTTAAGKINDGGSSPPASGSYVLFLDSGIGAGVASCRLVKTL